MDGTIATCLAIVLLGFSSRKIARHLCAAFDLGAFAPGALTGGVAIGLFLTAAGLFGRVFSDLDAGLWAAAILGALLALVVTRLPAPTAPLPRAARSTEIAVAIALLAMAAVYAVLAFEYQLHDETPLFGHKAMVEQLRRGTYPPYLPPFPQLQARYHYGFDLLAGTLARAFGLSSDNAIDLCTMGLTLLMGWSAAALAVEGDAESSAPLAVLAVHLGGGLAPVLLSGTPNVHPRCFVQYHHPSCGAVLYPTQLINVLQHPVAVGVPLALVLLLLLPRLAAPRWRSPAFWLLAGAATVTLSGLALGQFVYYALTSLAALAALPLWITKTKRWSGIPAVVAVVGLGLLLAHGLGGMLSDNPIVDPELLALREVVGFPPDLTWPDVYENHLINLGLGFLVLPLVIGVALVSRRPILVMMSAFACGALLVPQLWAYARSWDIVKFPSAASFFMALLYVLVVDRFLARLRVGIWLRSVGGLLLLCSGIAAASFMVAPLSMEKKLALYSQKPFRIDLRTRKVIDWLLANGYQNEEVIYAQRNITRQLSVGGGLSVVGADTDLYYLGIEMRELGRQRWLARRLQHNMDGHSLERLGVAWVVISEEEMVHLGSKAREALRDPARFELVYSVVDPRPKATRHIYRRVTTKPTNTASKTSSTAVAR